MNRWIGISAFAFMLLVNASLFVRDILPRWAVGRPPQPPFSGLAENEERSTQLAIYNDAGNLVGRSWSISTRTSALLKMRTITRLDALPIPGHAINRKLAVVSDFYFDKELRLSEMNVSVAGLGFPVNLRGEFTPPDTFPCQWQLDTMRGNFILEGESTRALHDITRPFEELGDLEVGQFWRVEIFNPLSGMMPGLSGPDMRPEPVIVRVTGKETMDHRGARVECHVVEADRIRAWVAPNGRVIRQSVTLPLVGTLTLVDEPYSHELRMDAQYEAADTNEPPDADIPKR